MLSVHIQESGNQESEEAQGVWLITSGSWIGGRQWKESLAGYSTKQMDDCFVLEHSQEGVTVVDIANFRFWIFSSESPKDL